MFAQEMDNSDTQQVVLNAVLKDSEDIWFDLYKSITSHKERAEASVEKQVQLRQKRVKRKLKLRKRRVEELKDTFMHAELRFMAECKAKGLTAKSEVIAERKNRDRTCPARVHFHREAGYTQRVAEQER